MEHLLGGTARRGGPDLAALAASLAEEGDGFDDDWDDDLVRGRLGAQGLVVGGGQQGVLFKRFAGKLRHTSPPPPMP